LGEPKEDQMKFHAENSKFCCWVASKHCKFHIIRHPPSSSSKFNISWC
jgi:hypothetical protein